MNTDGSNGSGGGSLISADRSDEKNPMSQAVAVVGMSCRFPGGADNPEDYWRLLVDGRDLISEIPADRFDVDKYFEEVSANSKLSPGSMYSRGGGFINGDIKTFDANFFGISPREVAEMDPQQRLLLEITWEGLENAGISPKGLSGSFTGVFIGISGSDYQKNTIFSSLDRIGPYTGTGVGACVAAGRISYQLGLQGPCIPIDTACSSSLVAVHYALQSLRSGECDMALAGGVSLHHNPDSFIGMCVLGAASRTDRCHTFDEAADGYVRGEGCGIVVLKKLTTAQDDGDNILAVIRGSAVNHDGRGAGLTVPNKSAQVKVISRALRNAGIQANDVDYVEVHGTGTAIGDPIEVGALAEVMGGDRGRPLVLGAVKTNIGHLEAAAGVAGLIKAILAMKNELIPANLHFSNLNPNIDQAGVTFHFPSAPVSWSANGKTRIAGVNAFGIGGTNAHMIISEAPEVETKNPEWTRSHHALCFSSQCPEALTDLAASYVEHLKSPDSSGLRDLTWTAHTGRSHMPHRLAVIGETPDDIAERLSSYADGETEMGVWSDSHEVGTSPRVCFLFTGQGSQYVNMAKELYETQPFFRAQLDHCDQLLREHIGRSLIDLMHGGEDSDTELLNQTEFTQPSLFALEYCISQLWQSWGIIPDVLLGHSVGEYVAACVAGIFGLEDGLSLIAARARLMQGLPEGGSMVSVLATENQVLTALTGFEEEVSVAGLNASDSLVVSGESRSVNEVVSRLSRDGIESQALRVSHAFHSPMMEPMLDDFARIASTVSYDSPEICLISNRTGREIGPDQINASYWVSHVRETVRFHEGLTQAINLGCNVFIETGPDPVLCGLGRRSFQDRSLSWLPSLKKGRADWQSLSESVARFFVLGGDVDWTAYEKPFAGRRVPLPNYPFQRERFWVDRDEGLRGQGNVNGSGGNHILDSDTGHPLLGRKICTAGTETIFQAELSPNSPHYLNDHKILGRVTVPGVAYIETALAAAADCNPGSVFRLHNVSFEQPMIMAGNDSRKVQTIVNPSDQAISDFVICSRSGESHDLDDPWIQHVAGQLSFAEKDDCHFEPRSLDKARNDCPNLLATDDEIYAGMRTAGIELGPMFQALRTFSTGADQSLGYVKLPVEAEGELGQYLMHPLLLDACYSIGSVGAAVTLGIYPTESELHLPGGMDKIEVISALPSELWAHGTNFKRGDSQDYVFKGDIHLFDSSGHVVAKITGFYNVRAKRRSIERIMGGVKRDFLHGFEWRSISITQEGRALDQEDWLILHDQEGIGQILADRVTSSGGVANLVEHCSPTREDADSSIAKVDFSDPSGFKNLLTNWPQNPGRRRRVAYLWSLDAMSGDETSPESLRADQEFLCGSFLHLVQTLAVMDGEKPDLNVITRGAQAVGTEFDALCPVQALLWGLGRTVRSEHPDLNCRMIDIDRSAVSDAAEIILKELCGEDVENQVAYRGNTRYGARITKWENDSSLELPANSLFRLENAERGTLDRLGLVSLSQVEPGPGEIQIEVRAVGLNFRDVLNALGMYPGDPGPLGGECAGEIVALGDDVDAFHVGQQVMCLGQGTLASHINIPAVLATLLPVGMNACQAATIPISFLTAYHALHSLARLSAGDRVLIHAGTGGLGMAAIQLAKVVGAEIFATAGSPAKRDLLVTLGVHHVMDSRSLDFADEIQRLTQAEGVDVVLNSLTGDFLRRSLDSLTTNGRFIEVGKAEILDDNFITEHYPKISYDFFDLVEIALNQPDHLQGMYKDLKAMFARGELEPLPLQTFPIRDAVKAFRHMQQARHIGKIVLTPPATIRADGTYLITGGAGALGLHVAHYFSERGAGALILAGRREMSDSARQQVTQMEARGTRVVFVSVDVTDPVSLERIDTVLAQGLPPLRGVIHSAGVLDDGTLASQNLSRFKTVLDSKVRGTWNLHQMTRDLPIDFFILFSSAAAIWGNAGQGNYAAANSFLDSLAHERNRQGLPAVSINWFAWSGEGMAKDLSDMLNRGLLRGFEPIEPQEGLDALYDLLGGSPAQIVAVPVDWKVVFEQFEEADNVALLSEVLDQQVEENSAKDDFLVQLESIPIGDQSKFLYERVEKFTLNVLGLRSSTRIDPRQPLRDIGLDSLMAVELHNALANCVQQDLPMTLFSDYGTLQELGDYLCEALHLGAPDPSGESIDRRENDELHENATAVSKS